MRERNNINRHANIIYENLDCIYFIFNRFLCTYIPVFRYFICHRDDCSCRNVESRKLYRNRQID